MFYFCSTLSYPTLPRKNLDVDNFIKSNDPGLLPVGVGVGVEV